MSLQGEPIVILGVFRSGTSCLSNALDRLGTYLGDEKDFFPPNENNLGGYWEIGEFQTLNLRGYAILGMSFYEVNKVPEDWRAIPGSNEFMNEARKLLNNKFGGK